MKRFLRCCWGALWRVLLILAGLLGWLWGIFQCSPT